MDNLIQQGRDPEWRLAFEDRLDEAALARVRWVVKNGESVDEPNQAAIAAGLARREQRRVLLLGLVLLPIQLGIAVFWVRLFATGRLPTVFGWFWIAVLLMLIGVVPFVLRRRRQVASRAAAVNDQIAVSGDRRGHNRATNDRTTADNIGHDRPSPAQLSNRTRAGVAGRHDLARLSDTEEVTRSSP